MMLRRSSVILPATLAWLLSASPAWTHSSPATPTAPEIETFVRSDWPYFSNRIRAEDALAVEPKRLISVPHTLCEPGYDGRFFECATLVVYELPSGRSRSSLVRHDVERDEEGLLHTAIVTRDRPIRLK